MAMTGWPGGCRSSARPERVHRMAARPSPVASRVPAGSRIAGLVPGSDFHDAWSAPAADASLPALGQFLKAAAATPGWVEACMALRNRVVRAVGLKDLGALGRIDPARPAADYRPGDRIGIFTLFENHPGEALLGDRDRHLDVTLSVHRHELEAGRVQVTITTVVKVHNLLGRLYMLPVRPMHRLIAPAVLAAVAA